VGYDLDDCVPGIQYPVGTEIFLSSVSTMADDTQWEPDKLSFTGIVGRATSIKRLRFMAVNLPVILSAQNGK
jgi:hypothetical protein